MTRILVAEHAGACYGVERALDIARRTLDEADGTVCTLGPLIHNPLVVEELEARGARVVDAPEDVEPGATLVMRTHGVPPSVEMRAREAGALVVDATCPYVKKVHAHAERLARAGYQVVVVGETGHPEVEGTVGHVVDALVIGSADEARSAAVGRRVGLVVQTTLARAVLHEVVDVLLDRCEELCVVDTICKATRDRQLAARELAGQVDVMVVVGGRNSANTTHLFQICQEECPRTLHVESASELRRQWFRKASVVGVTAGASTPAAHIESVVAAIDGLCDPREP